MNCSLRRDEPAIGDGRGIGWLLVATNLSLGLDAIVCGQIVLTWLFLICTCMVIWFVVSLCALRCFFTLERVDEAQYRILG